MLVCQVRWWIFWSRIHVFYHGLAFSNLSFSVNLFVFPLSVLLQILFRHDAYPFGFFHVLLVAIFYSKIFQLLSHPVVGMCSCHLPQLVGRIFYRCFGRFCFVCIALPFVDIFLIFLLSPVLSGLFPQVVLLFFLCCFFLFVLTSGSIFPLFYRFCLFSWVFFISVSCGISHAGFDFLFALFKGTPIFSQTSFAPALISSFNSIMFFGIYLIYFFHFHLDYSPFYVS